MKAIITDIISETPDISSFRLKPEQEIKFIPGQWMYVRLSPELKHHFTISASPTENFLQFTTKNTGSDYKKVLWEKKIGDQVEINGSFGSFLLDTNDLSPRLFIAGGIGITPFRSMIKFLSDKLIALDYKLIYSVKNKSEAAFKDIITETIFESEAQGHLNDQRIKALVPDWDQRVWWICGPPTMVEAMVTLAQKMGILPEKIKSEEFTGY